MPFLKEIFIMKISIRIFLTNLVFCYILFLGEGCMFHAHDSSPAKDLTAQNSFRKVATRNTEQPHIRKYVITPDMIDTRGAFEEERNEWVRQIVIRRYIEEWEIFFARIRRIRQNLIEIGIQPE